MFSDYYKIESTKIVRAKVTDNADPEHIGRLKVSYPWMTEDQRDNQSNWARISTTYASSEAGVWLLPEVDDEVLVLIEDGNFMNPIIIGCLYSKNNPPPQSSYKSDGNKNQKNSLKFIKTPGGHQVCFEDDPEEQSIQIKDSEDQEILIDSKNKKIKISDPQGNRIETSQSEKLITIEESSGNHIKLDGSKGSITITDNNGNSMIMNSAGIKLKDAQGSEIDLSGGDINIRPSGKIKLGKNASDPVVKGLKFMALFNSHTHQVPQSSSGVQMSMPPMKPMGKSELSSVSSTE